MSVMKRLKTDGVEVTYLDQGKGPLVIIAHCSSASHKEWLPLIGELAPDWRVLAPDFIGYGQSGAWPEGKVFTGQADLGVLLELANKTEKPIHLAGHSYGAALALEAARGLGSKVQSLTLVEPVAFNLLRTERRPESAEIEQLGIAVLTAVSNGNATPRQSSCAIGSAACAGGCRRRSSRRRSPPPSAKLRSNS
jgi:pimeloyl-ACP methyl ester carboxylesterase